MVSLPSPASSGSSLALSVMTTGNPEEELRERKDTANLQAGEHR